MKLKKKLKIFASGLVTKGEKYNKVIDIWSRANEIIAKSMMDNISTEEVIDSKGKKVVSDSFNSVFMFFYIFYTSLNKKKIFQSILWCDCDRFGNVPDCDSGFCGFESRQPPQRVF